MLKKPCRTLGFSKKAFSISLKVSLLITSHKKPSQEVGSPSIVGTSLAPITAF